MVDGNSIDILEKIEESMEEDDFVEWMNSTIEYLKSDDFDDLMTN